MKKAFNVFLKEFSAVTKEHIEAEDSFLDRPLIMYSFKINDYIFQEIGLTLWSLDISK